MTPAVIASLRDIVPLRPLTYSEHMTLAEIQAARFRRLLGITSPALPESAIADLPRVEVARLPLLPVSGATAWSKGRWQVLLRSTEPATRQRFSLAHELKHIVDHRFFPLTFSGIRERDRAQAAERICDYFAGCLLVPRRELKHAYCTGTQTPSELAQLFQVSPVAIETRLSQIGLSESSQRCDHRIPGNSLPFYTRPGSPSAPNSRAFGSNPPPVLEGATG